MGPRSKSLGIAASLLLAGADLPTSAASANPEHQESAPKPSGEIWILDQIIFQTQKDPKILEEIRDAHSMEALIAVLQKHQVQVQRTSNRVNSADLPADAFTLIANLPPGEPFIANIPDGDESVANVIVGREPSEGTGGPGQAAPQKNWIS